MTFFIRLFFLALLAASPACAQTSPGLIRGQMPTAAQWNSYFAAKQDVLGYTPVNKAGDTMLGRLVVVPSGTAAAGLNLPPGVAPTTPVDGDTWTTTSGMFVRINGSTVNLGSGLFSIANNTVLGNVSGISATPIAITATQLTTLCNTFTTSLAGCVTFPTSATGKILQDDDTWISTLGVAHGGTGATTLTANAPLIGNGASAIGVGTKSGNTTVFATATGTLTNGHCVSIDGSGNFIDAGGACTTGGGGGTVSAGTAGQLGYYATSSTTMSGNANATISAGALTLGIPTSVLGQLKLGGNTSGTATITPQAAAGTPTLTIGTATGTIATTHSAPLAIDAATGNVTCATCATTTSGGALSATAPIAISAGGVISITSPLPVASGGTNLATLTAHAVMLGNGTSSVALASIGTAGRLFLDQGAGADPAFQTMSGDATISSAGAVALAKATNSNIWSATANKYLDAAGANSALGLTTLTDAATVAVDMATGINFTVTLGGNRTLGNPTNTVTGRCGLIYVVQDATGSRTLTPGANWNQSGGFGGSNFSLTAAANSIDRLSYCVRSSTAIDTSTLSNFSH